MGVFSNGKSNRSVASFGYASVLWTFSERAPCNGPKIGIYRIISIFKRKGSDLTLTQIAVFWFNERNRTWLACRDLWKYQKYQIYP